MTCLGSVKRCTFPGFSVLPRTTENEQLAGFSLTTKRSQPVIPGTETLWHWSLEKNVFEGKKMSSVVKNLVVTLLLPVTVFHWMWRAELSEIFLGTKALWMPYKLSEFML